MAGNLVADQKAPGDLEVGAYANPLRAGPFSFEWPDGEDNLDGPQDQSTVDPKQYVGRTSKSS